MSIERVRAQRAYLDAADLEREADENIDRLESELARWQRIRDEAQAVGSTALTEATSQQTAAEDTLPPDKTS